MEAENPLIEFVKALARRQARIDAAAPESSNDHETPAKPAKRSK
ncbi:hypothetical protein [Agrobacterium pusense]|nr:hypothetical protein [Agrobacterium pusense]